MSFDNPLVTYDSATPSTATSGVFLNRLVGSESIAGILLRPSTGVLYALGTSSRLDTVNLSTGAATSLGTIGTEATNF